MNKINFFLVSDFFVEEICGGAEINDDILFKELKINIIGLKRIKSSFLHPNLITNNSFFIISNFSLLGQESLSRLIEKRNYIIYEHDHKYLAHRNPGNYEDYIAPVEDIINKDFYKNAKVVFCQSKFHKKIIEQNLKIDNIISVSGNLWDDRTLEFLNTLSTKNKRDSCSILNSLTPHKNTEDAVKFCRIKNYNYELISDPNYMEFLSKLSNNNTLVFFPKTPETLSRICVEARMCNMKVITNNLVGATQEAWFELKGIELILYMKKKREEIINLVLGVIK